MTKDDLLALSERIEAASGPDRYLDSYIWAAVGGADNAGTPLYTASLDAAMTLVPEDCGVNIDNGPCHWICLGKQKPIGRVDLKYPRPDYDGEGDSWRTVSAIAATPALALCAAALRARANQEPNNG